MEQLPILNFGGHDFGGHDFQIVLMPTTAKPHFSILADTISADRNFPGPCSPTGKPLVFINRQQRITT
jgi:hypothetical protein